MGTDEAGSGSYLTATEAAAYLRVSRGMLRRLELGIKVSPRKTVYRRSDLDAWMESKRNGGGQHAKSGAGS